MGRPCLSGAAMLRLFGICFLVLLAALLGCGGSSGAPVFVRASLASHRFTLANGLDVVLHPDPSFRSVAVNMRYDVGSRNDPEGRTGLAHLVEHLTFRGKPDGKLDTFSLLEERGSTEHNATTSTDATCYFETVPSEELPLALFIEAFRMARPLDGVDEPVFAAETHVVRNERRQRVDNVPYGNLDAIATYLLLDGHAYGRPTVGFAEDLERLTLADAQKFVAQYYRPNNATLVIAGGFEPRRATALVHELFDAIPGAPIPAAKAVQWSSLGRKPVHTTMATGAEAPAVALGWIVPAAGALGWHEMVLTAEMFGGWTKYRMGDKVRRIWTEVSSMEQLSVFMVCAELDAGASPDELIDTIDREIEWLADSGADVRLGGEKSRLLARRTLALEDIEHRAGILQTYVARYGNPDSIQAELHEFSVVSRRDIANSVERFLRRGRRVRVDAVPRPGAPKAGTWPTIGGRP